jgi:hypothetical protein
MNIQKRKSEWELRVGSGSWEWELGVRSQELGVGSRESGVGSRESGVGSGRWEWELEVGVGSGSWESGAGSRKLGVGSVGAGSWCSFLQLWGAYTSLALPLNRSPRLIP